MISELEIYSCIAAAGIASHLAYFIRGEHHSKAPVLFTLALALFAVGVFAQVQFGHLMTPQALMKTALIFSVYLTSLFSSMVIYRLFFHPLKGFPGPFLVKTSKLWHMFQIAGVNNFKWLDCIHKNYGDVVRTGECNAICNMCFGSKSWRSPSFAKVRSDQLGPNEITLFTPDALLALHGAGSNCKKGDWYDFMLPDVSLASSRDKVVHDQRRRIWDQAFSMKGLISLVLGYSHIALTNTSFTQLRKSS